MTTEAEQKVALSRTARLCVVAIGVFGAIGVTLAFALIDPSNNHIEAWLLHRFPKSHPDVAGLNGIMNPWVISIWICWSDLVLIFRISRGYRSLVVLIVVPILMAELALLKCGFTEPNWAELLGITTIGAFVGTISAIALFASDARAESMGMR